MYWTVWKASWLEELGERFVSAFWPRRMCMVLGGVYCPPISVTGDLSEYLIPCARMSRLTDFCMHSSLKFSHDSREFFHVRLNLIRGSVYLNDMQPPSITPSKSVAIFFCPKTCAMFWDDVCMQNRFFGLFSYNNVFLYSFWDFKISLKEKICQYFLFLIFYKFVEGRTWLRNANQSLTRTTTSWDNNPSVRGLWVDLLV